MTPLSPFILELLMLLISLCAVEVGNAIMCVRCQSNKDRKPFECERDPPPAGPCGGSSSVVQYCVIARELDKTGKQMNFIRDCTTARRDNTCELINSTNDGAPEKVCSNTCSFDACNSSPEKAAISVPLLLCSLGIVAAVVNAKRRLQPLCAMS